MKSTTKTVVVTLLAGCCGALGIAIPMIKARKIEKEIESYDKEFEKTAKQIIERHKQMRKELDERIVESQTILEKIEKGEDLDYEKKPWTGDFDEFMSNPDNQLIFE